MDNLAIKFIPTRTGKETMEINGFLIHSKYDPEKEAKRILEKELKDGFINIIFGFGQGFLAEELKKQKIDAKKILFIEPLKELINNNVGPYTVYNGMDLDEIEKEIDKKLRFYSQKINIICLPNYDKIFLDFYRDLLLRIKDKQSFNEIFTNTIRWKSEAWQENQIKNTLYSYVDLSLNVLEKKYNCPIVIASSGPSLTKQLSLLKEILPNVILIAAGSTLTTLLKNGIEPDYIISIEGALSNYEKHFKEQKLNKAQLIYSCDNNYMIQKNYKLPRYAFLDSLSSKLHNYLKRNFNIDLPLIHGGGSVANFALSIARFLTTGEIALIGQDLAYLNNETHAKGNKNNQTITQKFLEKVKPFEVEGYYGTPVLTNHSFITMKHCFEEIIQSIELKDKIYNCTEGGLKINGMKQMPFLKFCDQFVKRENIVSLYETTNKQNGSYIHYRNVINKDISIYKEILVELKKGQTALKTNNSNHEFSQKTLTALDKVDSKVEKLKTKVPSEKIFDPITLDIMNFYEPKGKETREEMYSRVYRQNIDLYSKTIEAIEKTIDFAKEAKEDAEKLLGE
ncbi:6-hydroxymethylpterin diphosphokinase MptE-like protein [Lysinibacillus sp. 1P01SD]|uniref:motility associated factor glycosyltransferase family protein n=1 Tax=Lysinibacillus sp. 1P01SD TaxID=3132285 RepID=UPI0039A31371